MKRYTFIMRIKPELKAEYQKAHDEIWPDMAQAIRDSGIRNYSISFRADGTLFAYLESPGPGALLREAGKDRGQRPMAEGDGPVLRQERSVEDRRGRRGHRRGISHRLKGESHEAGIIRRGA